MTDTMSESELLQASAAGSREAFGAIIERYQSLVCAVTYSATGDIVASEELAQETFIRAWKGLRRLENPTKFRPWLRSIARNLACASLRKRGKVAASLERVATVPAATPGPDELVSQKEREEIVWNAVGKIPEKYREPVVLYYRRQQSISEVAADLDLSEDVVRQRLHRGRRLIKAELASLVEDTLSRSGPGRVFAVAVVAALPALIAPPASAAVAGVVARGTPAARTLIGSGLGSGVSATILAWMGALFGPILGLLGGTLGAWYSIKNTHSPRERRFMIVMTVVVVVLLTALIGVPLVLLLTGAISRGSYLVCLAAFFIVLVPLIVWSNAHQRRIQIAGGTCQPPKGTPRRITKSGIYGSFSGSIFGPSAWLLVLCVLTRDWVSFAAIVGYDVLLFWAVTRICLHHPERYWTAAFVALCGLAIMTVAAVNLRWNAWMVAYRRSSAYDLINDVSLLTIDLLVIGAYLALGLPLAYKCFVRKQRETRL